MDTIKSNKEISEVFETGKRFSNPYFALIVKKVSNSEEISERGRDGRVAFLAGKKLGNAVWRNSAKRRLREICRACGGPWAESDVLLVARKGICSASYSKVLEACNATVKRAHLQE